MKNIIKITGLLVLIAFSFFYTDKVVSVISEKDQLMIDLKNMEDVYRVNSIDAEIKDDTIIPGLNGRSINLDKSYKKMREIGAIDKNLIVYDKIRPDISLEDNKDKFIIKGNNNKQMVSIVFILSDDKYLDKLERVLSNRDVVINYFVTSNYLISNSTTIASINNREFYSYGDNGKYAPDNIIFANNLISRITKNEAIYCLSLDKSKKVIDICSESGLYTIYPNIIINNNFYSEVKDKISSGSIIFADITNNNIMELPIVIDYIRGKGLIIGGLSNLLSENI